MDLVIINDYNFPVKIAMTPEEQVKGLMDCLDPVIMAFPGQKEIKNFWMKDTPMHLDLIFACDGVIVHKSKGIPFSLENLSSQSPCDLVVEFPEGILDAYPVNIGDPIKINFSLKTVAKKFEFNLKKRGVI